ncbi:dethiobiotin synthase [Tundrisphaera lichenicola]|uniref:dethiobiotin synthase n=1 Tax=Tundrisphaera lichenicola TaxID=2029860 RepID=UPI003EBDE99C
MTRPGLFVVGTDTGVGKTFVSSAIARTWTMAGHRVGVLKPLSSGAEVIDGELCSPDAAQLIEAVGGGVPHHRVAPIIFEEPLAPNVAARLRGISLHRGEIERLVFDAINWWEAQAEVMVVEGVGGFLCPIAEGMTVADLAVMLDYPVLIVAHRGLGTLNHTLLTVEAASSRSLRIAGVILNGTKPPTDPMAEATNAVELSRWLGRIAILADWEYRPGSVTHQVAPEAGNWYDLTRPSRRP